MGGRRRDRFARFSFVWIDPPMDGANSSMDGDLLGHPMSERPLPVRRECQYGNTSIPAWIRRCHWLWQQDDSGGQTTREDTPGRAWQRLMREDLDDVEWIAIVDCGDAIFHVDARGYVWCNSYPGAMSIGIVKGPIAAL